MKITTKHIELKHGNIFIDFQKKQNIIIYDRVLIREILLFGQVLINNINHKNTEREGVDTEKDMETQDHGKK